MRLINQAILMLTLVPALLSGAATAAESPRSFSLTYDLWQGGFNALVLETEITHNGTGYSAEFEARTSGLVGFFYPYSIEARSSGLASDPLLEPQIFRTDSVKSGQKRRQEIVYRDDGSLDVRHDPPREFKKRERVPKALMLGTVDPISAVYSVLATIERLGRCETSVPVFDGRRRYNIRVSQGGQADLAPSKYGIYSGPTTLCHVSVQRLAGFKTKKSARHLPVTLDVWLAPVIEGGPAVPVRMEGVNSLGHVVVHLAATRSEKSTRQAAR